MDSQHDLTTQDGLKEASKWFDNYGWLISPAAWMIKRLLPPTVAEQAEAAKKLIAAGKKAGLKDLTIDMDADAYGKLEHTTEDITAKAGSNRRMRVTVNYP